MTRLATRIRHVLWGVGLAAIPLMAAIAGTGVAKADPCTVNGNTVPGCVVQTDTGRLAGDRAEWMAVYCPAGAPYWWGGWSDTWSSPWHLISRNPIADGVGKADFRLSNTSTRPNNWSISIGCSALDPNGTCTGASKIAKDPGCPMSNRTTVCEQADNCWVTWSEQCISNNKVSNYNCTQMLFLTTCFSCESGTQRSSLVPGTRSGSGDLLAALVAELAPRNSEAPR